MIHTAYATWTDYVSFLGGDEALGHVSETEFPFYAARATEAIDSATYQHIPLTYGGASNLSDYQSTLVERACCMQIEYYGLMGIDGALAGADPASFSVGKVQVTNVSGGARPGALSPAARGALMMTGLLYAGMDVRNT